MKRTTVQWALVAFVIIATAARESSLIPNEPWGKFVGMLIAGLYTWGVVQRPKAVAKTTAKLLLPFFLILGTSCTVNDVYLKGDEDTYNAVAPIYQAYLEGDSAISDAQRARRLRTLDTWKLRIEKVGGKVK